MRKRYREIERKKERERKKEKERERERERERAEERYRVHIVLSRIIISISALRVSTVSLCS